MIEDVGPRIKSKQAQSLLKGQQKLPSTGGQEGLRKAKEVA
jgi:hypothetical protein